MVRLEAKELRSYILAREIPKSTTFISDFLLLLIKWGILAAQEIDFAPRLR